MLGIAQPGSSFKDMGMKNIDIIIRFVPSNKCAFKLHSHCSVEKLVKTTKVTVKRYKTGGDTK